MYKDSEHTKNLRRLLTDAASDLHRLEQRILKLERALKRANTIDTLVEQRDRELDEAEKAIGI